MGINTKIRKTLFLCTTAATLAFATASSAAIFSIDSILQGSDNGFGYSVFHDQTSHRMNGNHIEDPTTLDAGGFWNSDTGKISFSFNLDGAGTVEAKGNLASNAMGIGNISGLNGFIDMTFAGAANIADGIYRFIFDAALYTVDGANSYDSGDNHISLWGDLGNYSRQGCRDAQTTCIGADLRLQLGDELNEEPQPVPLPAGGILLLTALGGLVGARKAKKRKTA
jgi:hypothetical protein